MRSIDISPDGKPVELPFIKTKNNFHFFEEVFTNKLKGIYAVTEGCIFENYDTPEGQDPNFYPNITDQKSYDKFWESSNTTVLYAQE